LLLLNRQLQNPPILCRSIPASRSSDSIETNRRFANLRVNLYFRTQASA
jgi:hypothetical protein